MALQLGPKLLSALARMRLNVPHTAASIHKGESRSARPGSSVEFSDYREYEPGDDFRHIDWNIYNRLDRLYVKVFSEEQNQSLRVLIDTSSSMGRGQPAKADYARRIAAGMGYVALWSGDEARVATVNTRLEWITKTGRGRHHAHPLFDAVSQAKVDGLTNLEGALQGMGDRPAGSVTVLITDLMDADWEQALGSLGRRAGGRVLVHLLSPQDWDPDATGEVELVDAETGDRLSLSVDEGAVRAYRRAASEWIESVRRRCLELGIECIQLDTSLPIDELFLTVLRRRGMLR